jgi:hypothetical protein
MKIRERGDNAAAFSPMPPRLLGEGRIAPNRRVESSIVVKPIAQWPARTDGANALPSLPSHFTLKSDSNRDARLRTDELTIGRRLLRRFGSRSRCHGCEVGVVS